MAFNGSGTYTLPGAALTTGATVSSTENNTFRNDVATAFNKTSTRDGQTVPTANLPMGGYKHTGLAAGTTAGDSVRFEQFSSPPAIGDTAPNTGKFTALTTTGNTILGDASTDTLNVGNGDLVKDASGNVGIGTSSPGVKLDIVGSNNGSQFRFGNGRLYTYSTSNAAGYDNSLLTLDSNSGVSQYAWAINGSEKLRIDSSGNLLVGTTAIYSNEKFNVTQSAAAGGINVRLSSGPYNSTSYAMVQGVDGTTTRFYFPSNGGLYNYSANNTNLSDERTKTDIQDAGSYLSKICAIPVRTFKYKDQTDDLLSLGVIAQEVETVAPELVNTDGFGDDIPEDGVPLKGIYQTDLQYALMKCIQEQQALITQQAAALTTLTERITALEAK